MVTVNNPIISIAGLPDLLVVLVPFIWPCIVIYYADMFKGSYSPEGQNTQTLKLDEIS